VIVSLPESPQAIADATWPDLEPLYASAAMVLGHQQGLLDTRVIVSQPGGDLEIAWQGADSSIQMMGPAEFVFRGEYFLL
jgi:hypothetical protein